MKSTQLIEHDEQTDARGVDGIEFAGDEKLTGAFAVHAAPSRLKLLLGYRERVVRIDDGDMGTSHTGNFIELLANFRLESGGRCGLVKYLLTRYFNSSTVVLSKESARATRERYVKDIPEGGCHEGGWLWRP